MEGCTNRAITRIWQDVERIRFDHYSSEVAKVPDGPLNISLLLVLITTYITILLKFLSSASSHLLILLSAILLMLPFTADMHYFDSFRFHMISALGFLFVSIVLWFLKNQLKVRRNGWQDVVNVRGQM